MPPRAAVGAQTHWSTYLVAFFPLLLAAFAFTLQVRALACALLCAEPRAPALSDATRQQLRSGADLHDADLQAWRVETPGGTLGSLADVRHRRDAARVLRLRCAAY